MKKPETPNLDRMMETKERARTAGHFLQWLTTDVGYTFAQSARVTEDECPVCSAELDPVEFHISRLVPLRMDADAIKRLVAAFFGIDHDEASRERSRLLKWLEEAGAS